MAGRTRGAGGADGLHQSSPVSRVDVGTDPSRAALDAGGAGAGRVRAAAAAVMRLRQAKRRRGLLSYERTGILCSGMDWQQHAITCALTAAVLAAFARVAMRPPVAQSGDVVVLRYPKALRWFLLFAVAFLFALLIGVLWPLFAGNATDKDIRSAALGIPMSLLFIVFASCEGRVTLTVDHAGIGGRKAVRRQRRLGAAD